MIPTFLSLSLQFLAKSWKNLSIVHTIIQSVSFVLVRKRQNYGVIFSHLFLFVYFARFFYSTLLWDRFLLLPAAMIPTFLSLSLQFLAKSWKNLSIVHTIIQSVSFVLVRKRQNYGVIFSHLFLFVYFARFFYSTLLWDRFLLLPAAMIPTFLTLSLQFLMLCS